MANKITLKAQDGSTVEFYDEIKAQGGVKDVYFSTDKTYVVAFYRKPINANDKARINDIVNVHRNRIFLGSDDPDNPYTLIDLASGEKTAVQRSDTDYHSGNVAVLTANNVLKIYDGTTGALLTDVEVTPVEEGHYVSLTALPDGYALLQYNSENYDTVAIQTYSGDGLLWSSAGEAQQYTYASYLTNTANGPLLTAHRDNSDSSNLSDVLDMEGNLLLRRLGSCYSIDDLPDDCFIARQGFDYGLMDSTGQWLYRESIFSSPSDDAGGGYLY